MPFTAEDARTARNIWGVDNYEDTNQYLRHGERPQWAAGDPAEFRQFRTDIEAFTAKIRSVPPLKHAARTYRGVAGTEAIFGPPGSMTGRPFTDKGFVSVSSDHDSAAFYTQGEAGGAVVTVDIPAGMRALRFGKDTGGGEGFHEYVLPPGTRFAVLSDKMVDGTRQIRLMVGGQPRGRT